MPSLSSFHAIRDGISRPFAAALSHVGVTPLMVSVSGVVAMTTCALTMRVYPALAVAFLVVSVIADLLDGTLARYQGRASDAGRIVDVVADNVSFAIFITGLAAAGFVAIPWAATLGALVALSALVNTMRALRHARILRVLPSTLRGYWFFPNLAKAVCYPLFMIVVLGGPSYLPVALILLAGILFCEIVYRAFTFRTHA